jgi:hypothetical protein
MAAQPPAAPGAVAPAMQNQPAPGAVQPVRDGRAGSLPPAPAGPRGGSTPRPLPIRDAGATDGAAAALTKIATATRRDAVIEAIVEHARTSLDALVVLAVRQGMVFGDAGFAPDLNRAGIEAISLPLGTPSVLRTAVDTARAFSGRPPVGSAIQDRLLKLIGKPPGIVVAPISVAGRVVSLLVGGCRNVEDTERVGAELVAIAAACGAAYARLRS